MYTAAEYKRRLIIMTIATVVTVCVAAPFSIVTHAGPVRAAITALFVSCTTTWILLKRYGKN